MSPAKHLVALVSFISISLNLLMWCVPLLLLSLMKLAAGKRVGWLRGTMNGIYRTAVELDDLWLLKVVGASWKAPSLDLDPDQTCVVISNHRSWSDIFILQSVLSKNGPIVKFLCKKELAYIPILGLIFLAFDFPMLERRAGSGRDEDERRVADFERVERASSALRREPGAILTFAEGTRFSAEKHRRSASTYQNLLPPHAGGLTTILESLEDLDYRLLDVTLAYPREATFWEFLAGEAGQVEVTVEVLDPPRLSGAALSAWLNERWRLKDRLLGASVSSTVW